jgi:sulfane dehydrogenase subunit SoxC
VRLLLPGYEGNMNVKWLRRLMVVPAPMMTRWETSRYTDLQAGGKALMFTFPMEVKSVITRPSPGVALQGPGLYEVTGIGWSGLGTIRQVEVSADGGQSWAAAALSEPVLPRALTRFRIPWKWNGAPAVLKSRATDDSGAVQPTRDALIGARGTNAFYHYHAIQAWQVEATGEVKNVYG